MTSKINLSPEAKRELQRLRRKIARDQARSAQAEMDEARASLSVAASSAASKEVRRQGIAVMRNLVGLCRAVNSAFGVTVPVNLHPMESSSQRGKTTPQAYTDYQSITVRYPIARSAEGGNTVYANDSVLLSRLISEVKAFQYHELGHILFSTVIHTLFNDAGAATSDNWKSIHGKDALWWHVSEVKRTHNILEDQRMETALVNESPYLARYLTLVVLNWVLDKERFHVGTHRGSKHTLPDQIAKLHEATQYLLVVNRRYLPIEARRTARASFVEVFGEDDTVRAETIIRTYCSAQTAVDMVKAVFAFHELLSDLGIIPPVLDDHPSTGARPKRVIKDSADSSEKQDDDAHKIRLKVKSDSKTKKSDDKPKNPNDKQDQDKGESGDEGDEAQSEGGEGDDESVSDADSGNSDGNSEGDSGNDADDSADGGDSSGSASGADDPSDGEGDPSDGVPEASADARSSDDVTSESESLNNQLRELAQNIAEEISQDADVQDTVCNINRDMNSDGHIPLAPETRVSPMLDDLRVVADEISSRLTTSFDAAVSAALPVWEENHRDGVLNAFRYRTRNAGDHHYRRLLASDGNSGLDIAVTLLLDTSGSMCSEGGNLGVSAWAIKTACDRVGIDCTVLTFDSQSRELWRAEDRNVDPVVLHPDGGTSPHQALERLDEHRDGQTYHLVIVLTDGIWTGDVSFNDHISAGRVVLGVALGSDGYAQDLVERRGVHQAVTITDLMELPEIVRNFLLNFLG